VVGVSTLVQHPTPILNGVLRKSNSKLQFLLGQENGNTKYFYIFMWKRGSKERFYFFKKEIFKTFYELIININLLINT